jgi:hypothetical protein
LDELGVSEGDVFKAAGVGGVGVVGEGVGIVIVVVAIVRKVGVGVRIVVVVGRFTGRFDFGLEGSKWCDAVWVELAEGE